jgi:hypothetical protein
LVAVVDNDRVGVPCYLWVEELYPNFLMVLHKVPVSILAVPVYLVQEPVLLLLVLLHDIMVLMPFTLIYLYKFNKYMFSFATTSK